MEGEDGADTLSGVVPLAGSTTDDGQQDGNDLLDAEGTESGQSDDTVDAVLAVFELPDEQGQEFLGDDGVLAVAQVTHHVDGETLGGHVAGAASGLQQIGDGDQSGLLQIVGSLNGARFPQVLSD